MVIRNESDFYQKFIKKYFFMDDFIYHIRIENSLERGTPDIWFVVVSTLYPKLQGWIELKYGNNTLSSAQKDFIEETRPFANHWTFYWQKDKIKIVYNGDVSTYVIDSPFDPELFQVKTLDYMFKMRIRSASQSY